MADALPPYNAPAAGELGDGESFPAKLARIVRAEPVQVIEAVVIGVLQLLLAGSTGNMQQHVQTVRMMRWAALLLMLIIAMILALRLPLPNL